MNTIHTVWTGYRLVTRAPSGDERTNTENSDLMRYAWVLHQGAVGFADWEVLSLIHRWFHLYNMFGCLFLDGIIADVWSVLLFKCDPTALPQIHKFRLVKRHLHPHYPAWWIQIFAVFFPRHVIEETYISPWRTDTLQLHTLLSVHDNQVSHADRFPA